MRMRASVVACVPVLVAGLAGCQGVPWPSPIGQPPAPATTAPPAPVTSSPAAVGTEADEPRQPRKRRLSGPRTACGEIQPPHVEPMAVIAVLRGRADCAEAMRVFRTYYRADTPKQGSAGVATVRGWQCAGNSAAQAASGRFSSCRKGGTVIVADVIP